MRGGLHFGGLAAVFYAAQMLSGVYRGRRDFFDAVHGGLAAGAMFGLARELQRLGLGSKSCIGIVAEGASSFLALPNHKYSLQLIPPPDPAVHRSVRPTGASPLRSLVLGAALGGSLGVPFGLLQDQLIVLLPEEHRSARLRRQQQTEAVIAGTGAVCWVLLACVQNQKAVFLMPICPLSRPLTQLCLHSLTHRAAGWLAAVEPERVSAAAAARRYDVTAAIIRQMEASLSSSPTQQQQRQQQQEGMEAEQQGGQPPSEDQRQQQQQRLGWWRRQRQQQQPSE